MPSPDSRAAVRQSAARLVAAGSGLALGLSGGIDSVVLLDILYALRAELGIRLEAIHINHGLSSNAESWERFCAERCTKLGVGFESVRLHLTRNPGESLEAVARAARYAALVEFARRRGHRAVALAHHQDDQAETVQLQLLRGAGPRGIAAMPEWREDHGVGLWRPLLDVTRNTLAEYAVTAGLSWVDDESNADSRFKRNFIRTQVMPAIERGFPSYRTSLARAGHRAAEAAQLSDDLADIDMTTCAARADESILQVRSLRELGALRARNVIRRMIARNDLSVPDARRLAEFVRQALESDRDRNPQLALAASHRLSSARGMVRIIPAALEGAYSATWQCESEVVLPHGNLRFTRSTGAGIDASKVPPAGLVIRPRAGGEHCRLAADRPNRTLKYLMQEAGIPAPMRSDWPLLVDGSEIVAIPGVGVSIGWKCRPGTPGWTVIWSHGSCAMNTLLRE